MSVCAVVVTFNRLELLRECLAALAAQEHPADLVLVVDNASTDGTVAAIRAEFPWADVLALDENLGGAGGFHRGLAEGHARGFDWIWLMDDDTIPTPTALSALLDGVDRAPAGKPPLLMSGTVLWTDDTHHKMNRVHPLWQRPVELVLGAAQGLMLFRTATFVSLLVSREAVDRYGLPYAHYFIWSDDVEYTARVSRTERAYVVPESIVYHKTKASYSAITGSRERFYYHVRNSMLIARGDSFVGKERWAHVLGSFSTIGPYLAHNRWSREAFAIVARGIRDGVRDPVR